MTRLLHKLLCALGRHDDRTVGDRTHIWRECARCGAFSGFEARDNVRVLRRAGLL